MIHPVSEYELAAQMRRMEWAVRAGAAFLGGVLFALLFIAVGLWK